VIRVGLLQKLSPPPQHAHTRREREKEATRA